MVPFPPTRASEMPALSVCACTNCLPLSSLLSFWFADDTQEVRWFRSNAQRTLLTHSLLCLLLLLLLLFPLWRRVQNFWYAVSLCFSAGRDEALKNYTRKTACMIVYIALFLFFYAAFIGSTDFFFLPVEVKHLAVFNATVLMWRTLYKGFV